MDGCLTLNPVIVAPALLAAGWCGLVHTETRCGRVASAVCLNRAQRVAQRCHCLTASACVDRALSDLTEHGKVPCALLVVCTLCQFKDGIGQLQVHCGTRGRPRSDVATTRCGGDLWAFKHRVHAHALCRGYSAASAERYRPSSPRPFAMRLCFVLHRHGLLSKARKLDAASSQRGVMRRVVYFWKSEPS